MKTDFIINKGEHYSKPRFSGLGLSINKSSMEAKVVFDRSCTVHSYSSWSKLFGFSVGSKHHKGSIRVAWRTIPTIFGNVIQLCLYAYTKSGKRYIGIPICIDYKKEHTIKLSLKKGVAKLSINTEDGRLMEDDCYFGKTPSLYLSYLLRPYYGGLETAPNDMLITIEKLL